MAKIDLNKLKGKVKEAVDATKQITDSAVDKVKETTENATAKMKDSANSVIEKVKDSKLPDVQTAKERVKDFFRKDETNLDSSNDTILNIKAVSTNSAIKIIYYLMAVDGQIFHSEEEKFDSIGIEINPSFIQVKDVIVSECQKQMDKVIDVDDFYDVLQDGVEEALILSKPGPDSFITPKLLVWDLLTVAYSDESYDETERKLIKYVVRKLNIDKAVFLEMESSILTLLDIEKELSWIKTTNRPYLTIEAMVNELMDRKNVIFESVKDLIAL